MVGVVDTQIRWPVVHVRVTVNEISLLVWVHILIILATTNYIAFFLLHFFVRFLFIFLDDDCMPLSLNMGDK